MKAFILAAGLGTRLGNLTKDQPKALVKVNGTELLSWTVLRLKEQGFNEFVINVHYHARKVMDFLKKNDNFGCRIHISDEQNKLLGTGGALVKAARFLKDKEPVLVHNVDIISEVNFPELMAHHKSRHALATLCVRNRLSDRVLIFDNQMQLKGWRNKKTGVFKWSMMPLSIYTTFAFSGIYVISPDFISKIKQKGRFSIIDTWLEMAGQYSIIGYPDLSANWFDLGTPEKIKKAELYLKNKES